MADSRHAPAVLRRLARRTIRTRRGRFALLFAAVALAAFLLFCVFTLGLSYFHLSRMQNTRLYGAEYDIAVLGGFTRAQYEALAGRADVQSVGVQTYAGYVTGAVGAPGKESGLLWCDETFWQEQAAPARTEMTGAYPQARDEILVTRDFLAQIGQEGLGVGDSLTLTCVGRTGERTEQFVISGLWDGYGDRSVVYVSRAFYEQTGYELEVDGILLIRLRRQFVTPGYLEQMRQSLNLTGRQSFQPSAYLERSLLYAAGLGGLCLVIALSAYLLIYQVLRLSVAGSVRQLGLLQCLGVTRRQLAGLLRRQMALVGAAGLAAGVLLGALASLFVVPWALSALGVDAGQIQLGWHPLVLVLTVAVTAAALLCAVRRPVRLATAVSPVEAARYTPAGGRTGRRRRVRAPLLWRLAGEQLTRDKRRTAAVLLSLAVSLSLFYCLTTLIFSQGERTVAPLYWDADLIVRNGTPAPEQIDSLRPALTDQMAEQMQAVDGVGRVQVLRGAPVVFSDGAFLESWVRGLAQLDPYAQVEQMLADCRADPARYYGMLKGIDRAELAHLNRLLETPVDPQAFERGQVCILSSSGFTLPDSALEAPVTFSLGGQTREMAIAAVSEEGYYGGTSHLGPTLLVSQAYLDRVCGESTILGLLIRYDPQADAEQTEERLLTVLEQSGWPDELLVESRLEELRTIEASRGEMMAVGTAISLLLGLVGALCYVNTIAGSVQGRKLTFAVMESVGMTRGQVRGLLMREGALYALGALLLTATVGTAVTYLCFSAMNYMDVPSAPPAAPLCGAAALALLLCTLVPLLAYRVCAGGRPVVERLRDFT